MKVLWISHSPGNYNSHNHVGSGGWVQSLQLLVEKEGDIELGLAFVHPKDSAPVKQGNTTYFPIRSFFGGSKAKMLLSRLLFQERREAQRRIQKLLEIISEFKPDLIHIWGCEHYYIEIVKYTKIPCVVDIQSILMSWLNVFLPPGVSEFDLIKFDKIRFFLQCGLHYGLSNFKRGVKLEASLLNSIKYWIGRTEWDRDAISVLSKSAKYYQCNRMLPDIYFENRWRDRDNMSVVITSIISPSLYKGYDLILKTAEILEEAQVDFVWNVCGVDRGNFFRPSIASFFEKKFKIHISNQKLVLHGKLERSKLADLLLKSDVYVHPSYIENSCNALSEAQLLGVPSIGVNAGGVASILANNSGVLVPANDPLALAAKILKMKEKETAMTYSERGRCEALKRNNPCEIKENLKNIYNKIINTI